MGQNNNRGWKPWVRDFNSLVFGIKHKKPYDANPDWTRKIKQARRKNQQSYNKAQRRARRNGWGHP